MKTNTPQQARKIAAMMAGRRLYLKNPGRRAFPKYVGQSTRDYVREYEYENRVNSNARSFELDDLLPPVGYVGANKEE